MRSYSHFFQTLHDEQEPVGYLGRGTHCSILRAVVFHDEYGAPLPSGAFLDFSIIWDEDHDTRVIEAIERIYLSAALPSFMIIGERKATLTAILTKPLPEKRITSLTDALRVAVRDVDGDSWAPETAIMDSKDNPIIADSDDKVALYLRNLVMLWQLGIKTAEETRTALTRMSGTPSAQMPPRLNSR